MNRVSNLRLILLVALALSSNRLPGAATNTNDPFPRFPPVEPSAAGRTFKTLDGFEMQLLAAEPLVTDPVAMAYDENGLAYVVEMNDYPYTDKKAHEAWKDNTTDKPIGRIRVLEDTDGDGKFDKSTVFAEGLSWPSGICCWKGGVYVTATPDIWYFKDTDGDHKADIRRKVFTGFRKYNVQAVMNNPTWGYDNKLYVAGSGNGGKVVPGEKPDAKPIVVLRNDFRINPVTETFEAISGGARFGLSFDDWGNRFLCNIRNPAQQVLIENRYLARNPYLPTRSAVYDVRDPGDTLPVFRISPQEPWREVRAKRWTAENKVIPRSELVAGGVFTSSSGITIYRGAAYPKKFCGNAFVCEVANNLVHRQTLEPDGVTFKAERADQNADFVASTDTWFRPVNFVNAPDGTLHVCDMYREIIEHPWSIPDDIREKLDLESGRDRGRIYRLAPPGFHVPKPPRLGKATSMELVAALENPNSWWRETAQRLLFERQDQTATTPLRKLLRKSRSPLARMHALWTLEGLGALKNEDLLPGLSDKAAGVRLHALKLSETRLAKAPELLNRVLQMAEDPEIRVRYQAAFILGGINDPRMGPALFSIAKKTPDDAWIRTAVLCVPPDTCASLLHLLLKDNSLVASAGGRDWLGQLAYCIGAQNQKTNLLDAFKAFNEGETEPENVRAKFLNGLGEGLRQAGKNFRTAFPDTNSIAFSNLNRTLSEARAAALAREQHMDQRTNAIQLLGYEDFARAREVFVKLLGPTEPQEVQQATIHAVAGFKSAEAATVIITPWRSYTPPLRQDALGALFARRERLSPLLDALENKTISPAQIDAPHKTQMLANSDAILRERAARVFGQNMASSRAEAVEKYKAALNLKGDLSRGRKVFENNCVTCHRLGDLGNEVGPNLETVRDWDAEKLLFNILDPNREVGPAYVSYDVELKDGTSLSGLVAEETANGITLKRAGNAQETILRQNISRISSSGMSLMPEGLETAIPLQDMADLIAFVLKKQ